jgi:mannosyltransferase OCH1-like enzyme
MHNIPRQVHVCWHDKNIVNNTSPLVLNGIRNLIDLNPTWTITIHNDNDIDLYLKQELENSDYDLVKDSHIVARSDVWRLLKLYREGGLYVDIDRFCNKNLDVVIGEKKCILPIMNDYDFSQDFMASEPQNPIYLTALIMNLERRRQGHTNTYFLGAQTYMHAVTKEVCGEIINTDPGSEVFAEIRQQLAMMNFIGTSTELPPWHTVIYEHVQETWRGSSDCMDWEQLKRNLYADYNVKHWTGEW